MINQFLRFILLFFILPFSGLTQQYHFKQYSLEQGLSRSGVYDILQDRNGFLWVATEGGGLCKFDGQKFKTFTRFNGLASEKIRVIFEDRGGLLWLGTTQGLSYYDGHSFESITEKDGINSNYIRSIAQDAEGNIWVGSNQGISVIDPAVKGVSKRLKLQFSLPNKRVRSLYQQGDVMWIGTDGGLCRYLNGEIHLYTTENGLSDNTVLSIFIDSKEQLWVGTNNGLNKFVDTTFQHWTVADGLIHNRVRNITEDHQHNLWIGTSDGISIFNGKGFKNLDESNGLSNDRIRSLTRDHFNNIWVGTYFGGIMRFNHQDFVAYTTKDGLKNSQILSITEDEKGDIIVGTYEGVAKLKIFNDKLVRIKSVTKAQGLIDNAVKCILKDDNDYYWYGSNRGISVIKGNHVTHLKHPTGLKDPGVTVIKKIQDIYWVGTENGLISVKTTNYQNFETTLLTQEDGLAGQSVSEIKAGKNGAVWVSFLDGKITRVEKDKMINPIMPEGAEEISALALDKNNEFWIGTNGNGLFHGLYLTETHEFKLKRMSTATSLSSNYIFSIITQKNGNVWLGHENGLDLISPVNDSAYIIQTYGPNRGFYGLQNNLNAAYEDQQNNLWFGTVNGLFCLKNDKFSSFSDGKASISYIREIRLDGNAVDWDNSTWCSSTDGPYKLPTNLVLPYDRNNLTFEFIGLNYINPLNVNYSWKLEGYDNKWKNESHNHLASYTNLDPGKYTFKLRSSNEHGMIVGDPISFEFKILKPWWSTWLVRILALLLGLVLIATFISLRTRQLRKKQRMLEKTIAERTEEITSKSDELQAKNKEIMDSILYSRRIQQSILPGPEKMTTLLPPHFVLYKPKDIVSGDFYWIEKMGEGLDATIFIAVADCTGHGVPGAMVSLVGTRALNSSVRENLLQRPADILNQTNTIMLEAFTDEESGAIIKDGMDIALCAFKKQESSYHFEFAGAHNTVWIIRSKKEPAFSEAYEQLNKSAENDEYALYELKGNKQPIGYFEKHVPFDNHTLQLLPGDRFYISSDGYADQFGGPKGKKYKYKALKNKLLDIQNEPITSHEEILRQEFRSWKGDLEQLDDVCFIGVELE